MPPSSVAFSVRPAFCIQKIIQVTMATASERQAAADELLRLRR